MPHAMHSLHYFTASCSPYKKNLYWRHRHAINPCKLRQIIALSLQVIALPSIVAKNNLPVTTLVLLQVLRAWVTNAIFVDRKETITLWETGTVINLADSGLTTTLLETQPCGTGVSYDVSSDRLLRIRVEHSTWASIDLGYNLICDDNGNTKFVGEALKGPHELGQVSLSRRQLSSSNEISSVQ